MLHKEMPRTQELVRQIDELGLLQERPLTVPGEKGVPNKSMDSFRVLDETACANLGNDALGELHRSGALALIQAHLISLHNLHDGALAKHHKTAGSANDGLSLDSLFGEDDDLSFDF